MAKGEFARRHDVYTLDAYAGALHVNGNDREACRRIEEALAVGVRDAKLMRHAGEIASAAGAPPPGQIHFGEAEEFGTPERGSGPSAR